MNEDYIHGIEDASIVARKVAMKYPDWRGPAGFIARILLEMAKKEREKRND